MNAVLSELIDLVSLLNLEPRDTELTIEFFDRAVCEALDAELITAEEADLYAAYLTEVAP